MNKLSVVTVSMNRTEYLVQSAAALAKCDTHHEHIIVDWSSMERVRREKLPDDDRIRLYRVNGEEEWCLSRAYNFGFSHAGGDVVLKMDSDVLLEPSFFYHNDWSVAGLIANDKELGHVPATPDLSGLFFASTDALRKVGGFHEWMKGWGGDEIDLFARIRALTRYQRLNLDSVDTIKHEDAERFEAQGSFDTRAWRIANFRKNIWIAQTFRWPECGEPTKYHNYNDNEWEKASRSELPKEFEDVALGQLSVAYCERSFTRPDFLFRKAWALTIFLNRRKRCFKLVQQLCRILLTPPKAILWLCCRRASSGNQ